MSLKKYHTEIKPIMMIPGLTYLMSSVTFPKHSTEIIFSYWEYLPTNRQLSVGVKMYYTLPNENDNENEYYVVVIQNKYGAFAGMNNLKFYKDYDNIVDK